MEWEDVKNGDTYEVRVNDLRERTDSFTTAVREIERVFDDETFTITVKVLRRAERVWPWRDHKVIEKVG